MKPEKPARIKLPHISEQMKAWSSALEAEIGGWPAFSTRPFFGFTALYRKGKLFGLLPRTRNMRTSNSLVFKLESAWPQVLSRMQQDSRIGSAVMQKARWYTLELAEDADLSDALEWLALGYEAAGKRKKRA